jgi:hypothetical protein
MPADGQERQAGYGSCSMPADVRGRTGDGLCSMPTDVQRQGRGDGSYIMSAVVKRQSRRWIIQHVCSCTEAGQEMDYTACRQMYSGRAGDSSGCRWTD